MLGNSMELPHRMPAHVTVDPGITGVSAVSGIPVVVGGAVGAFLGIPAGMLASGFIGAMISHVKRDGTEQAQVLPLIVVVLTDTFIGCWAAVSLLSIPYFAKFGVHAIHASVLGGICALGVQWVRAKFWILITDQLQATVKEFFGWVRRKLGGGSGA